MSLTSLRGYAGLASTAFETARSTFKAMAEAAVQPEGAGAAGAGGADGAAAGAGGAGGAAAGGAGGAAGAAAKAVMTAEPATSAEQIAPKVSADEPRKGVRRGVALDAYA